MSSEGQAKMIDTQQDPGRDAMDGRRGLAQNHARWLGPARLAIGLIWGFGVWGVLRTGLGPEADRSWPATQPGAYGPLLIILAYLPVVAVASIGRLRVLTTIVWLGVATVGLGLLGLHDVARQSAETLNGPPYLSPPALGFLAVTLFIAHHLVAPADAERRWIASFAAYFDQTWKAGVQLTLALGFTGVFWLLVFLGAALFRVIGLDFLLELIGEPAFALPVSGLVFAIAVHLADVRDGLIRGVRTIGLMLLSWLLLLLTILVAGFLAALPFTGLEGLWETGNATALLLAASAALIVLINTAYQDGRADNLPPMVLRVAVRVAAVLLAPLILIAFWGLGLRIGQHGLTPDRMIALACAILGALYAFGYGLAALVPLIRAGSPWMKALETTNIVSALVAIMVLLALFSPLADPASLSVRDQLTRLELGRIQPDRFDYRFLRFDSGRAGEAALATLAQSPNPDIARRAQAAIDATDRYVDAELTPQGETPAPIVEPWPKGTALPPEFIASLSRQGVTSVCTQPGDCLAVRLDLNGDGIQEILVASRAHIGLHAAMSDGSWSEEGYYPVARCPGEQPVDARALLRSGVIRPAQNRWPELSTGGRFASRLNSSGPCTEPSAERGP